MRSAPVTDQGSPGSPVRAALAERTSLRANAHHTGPQIEPAQGSWAWAGSDEGQGLCTRPSNESGLPVTILQAGGGLPRPVIKRSGAEVKMGRRRRITAHQGAEGSGDETA